MTGETVDRARRDVMSEIRALAQQAVTSHYSAKGDLNLIFEELRMALRWARHVEQDKGCWPQ